MAAGMLPPGARPRSHRLRGDGGYPAFAPEPGRACRTPLSPIRNVQLPAGRGSSDLGRLSSN